MRKALYLFLAIVFLSGCATYRFQKGQPPYDKGYVASRDDYVIPEYTIGEDNTVPKIKLAKERFARRKNTVEDYYKKMGYIENRFKMAIWDPFEMFWKLAGGIFWLPVLAIRDYQYEHDPQYREKIDKLEAEKDRQEEERIKNLKAKLSVYVRRDLQEEMPKPQAQQAAGEEPKEPQPIPKEQAAPPLKEEMPLESIVAGAPGVAPPKKEPPKKTIEKELDKQETLKSKVKPQKPKPPKQKPIKVKHPSKVKQPKEKMPKPAIKKELRSETTKEAAAGPSAVIIARPANGYSPLRVHFSGAKSNAPRGSRIISYAWDFGDGDTSTKEDPVNTFYSGESLPQHFTVTLTVQDDKGNSATAEATIEVLNK